VTKNQVAKLSRALREEFGGRVEAEPINGRGRYRVALVSEHFRKMTHVQRQDAIWKVVDEALPRDATVDISLILAFTPDELVPA
jgi:stress-induced morphogen